MTDLLALANRAEKLTGPDRRMDAAICRIIDLPKCEYLDCLPDVMGRILDRVEAGGDDPEVPAYTSSLDAAMSLVPEGHTWAGGNLSDNNVPWCCITNNETSVDSACLSAVTFCLALCAAALRARANGSTT